MMIITEVCYFIWSVISQKYANFQIKMNMETLQRSTNWRWQYKQHLKQH